MFILHFTLLTYSTFSKALLGLGVLSTILLNLFCQSFANHSVKVVYPVVSVYLNL
jgi:hypothetical protein